MGIQLDPERTMVYILAATVSGSDKEDFIIKAVEAGTDERRLFLNQVLLGREKTLHDHKIIVLPTRQWLSVSVPSIVLHSSSACNNVLRTAKTHLLLQYYVLNVESLESLGGGLTYDERYRLIYLAYAVDEPSRRAVYKF